MKNEQTATLPFDTPADAPRFDGETYDPGQDHRRLGGQALRVFNIMRDGKWRTLRQISDAAEAPEASVSARLRDFRKKKFGSHAVEDLRDKDVSGLWWYRLVPNPQYKLGDASAS